MPNGYTTVAGDTYSLISAKVYGDQAGVARLRSANPTIIEPLFPGIHLVTPANPFQPRSQTQKLTKEAGAISITMDGKTLSVWESVNITTSLDSFSTIALRAPFDPSIDEQRAIFKPFSFQPIVVYMGEDVIFTGTVINITPTLTPTGRTVEITAYSTPGVLNDCTLMPKDQLSWTKSKLNDIALDIMFDRFSIRVFFSTIGFDRDAPGTPSQSNNQTFSDIESEKQFDIIGAPFENISLKVGQKILPFLQGLAQQRGLVITDTVDGNLLFQKGIALDDFEARDSVAALREGFAPLVSVKAKFDAQNYYSIIQGVSSTQPGFVGDADTSKNLFLEDLAYRPFSFSIKDTQSADLSQLVDAKLGRMFGNAIQFSVKVSTWFDSHGVRWTPNTILRLESPSAMIYRKVKFIIKTVSFSKVQNAETATLTLVLPGSFSGEIPESLPWG